MWISNTVEDQPWQADSLDVDAFDFSTNMDSFYRVKIEGRLLDDEEGDADSNESDDESDIANGDAIDEDEKEKKASKPAGKQYRFSHFFKAMTVDFDRSKAKEGTDQSVEWKKPVVAANAANLPNAADFDQLEFKRGGDENVNITINLVRDDHPERFHLSSQLADILDTNEATRAEAVMGVWDYVKAMGLQEDDEKRSFDCDDRLRAVSVHVAAPPKKAKSNYENRSCAETKDIYQLFQSNSSHICFHCRQSSSLTLFALTKSFMRILNPPSTTFVFL